VLIAGLGAMAAVLLLVFKDTILGLVASIQLSANDMLKIGDWMHIKSQTAADGGLQSMENMEKEYLLKVLNMTNWRIRGDHGAAQILEIKPTTLESRMKKLGIKNRPDTPM